MRTIHPEPGDKVLWIRFRSFGDTLESAADARNFKKQFPNTHLTFLTQPEYAELFRVQPYIDETLGGCKKPFADWLKVLKRIRAGQYRWVVSDHRGGRTALLALFSRAARRVGTCPWLPPGCNYHLDLDSWFRSFGADAEDRSFPSIFPAAEDREEGRILLESLPEHRLFVSIGAGKAEKLWKTARWIEFLRPLLNRGWGAVLNGHGPLEESIGKQIENALPSPNLLNLVGTLDFRKMSGVAYACTLALGNDTGPLHLAALSGVPTMGLFSHHTSQIMGLRMPWFRELCAEDWAGKGKSGIPLENLPAEPVIQAFGVFIEEFLPKAFAWRGKSVMEDSRSFLQNSGDGTAR